MNGLVRPQNNLLRRAPVVPSMKTALLTLSALALATVLCAQSAVGTWKTIDDETGEAKSHIEIYEKGGKLYGKIAKTLRANAPVTCETCSGARAGKPYIGLEIITAAEPDGEAEWEGKIYDPEADRTYKLVMWIEEDEPNKLYVRGKHWTGLYRTQEWSRL